MEFLTLAAAALFGFFAATGGAIIQHRLQATVRAEEREDLRRQKRQEMAVHAYQVAGELFDKSCEAQMEGLDMIRSDDPNDFPRTTTARELISIVRVYFPEANDLCDRYEAETQEIANVMSQGRAADSSNKEVVANFVQQIHLANVNLYWAVRKRLDSLRWNDASTAPMGIGSGRKVATPLAPHK